MQRPFPRVKRVYPPVSTCFSRKFVSIIIGVALILGAIVLETMIYLAIDSEFCGTNSNHHTVTLANTTLFNPNRGRREFPVGEASVYDGSYDLITSTAESADTLRYKNVFVLSLLLNYTAYSNGNKVSFLDSLKIVGNSPDASIVGGTVSLYISNPSRKRVHVTEPWFDYGYWTRPSFTGSPTANEIPMWLVDMSEAARGRRGGRICAPNYSLEIYISDSWFQLDPLFIREYAGTAMTMDNVLLRGNTILDLTPHVRNETFKLKLTRADVAYLYLNKPPRALLFNYTDKESFLEIVLPFSHAPRKQLCRTITMSFGTARYMCPSIVLDPQPVVDVEIISAGSSEDKDEILCQEEKDGSITMFTSEPTSSNIFLIVRPLGRGKCTCMNANGGKQCVTR